MMKEVKDDDVDFDIVEEGVVAETDADKDEDKVEAGQKPAAKADDDDDDDDDGEGEAPKAAASEEVDAATLEKRERRRVEKKEARERKKRYIEELEEKVQQLSEATRTISERQTNFQRSNDAQRLKSLENRYARVNAAIAEAVSNGDGESMTQLIGERDNIKSTHANLLRQYRAAEAQPQQRSAGPDPRVKSRAQEWATANNWYKTGGRDEDSAVVDAIDKDIAASGVSPASSLYWKLLDEQVRKALPHKYKPAAPAQARSGPPISSGKSTVGGKRTVTITAARKDALVKAGVWGDKAAMKPYLVAYAEFDKNNQAR